MARLKQLKESCKDEFNFNRYIILNGKKTLVGTRTIPHTVYPTKARIYCESIYVQSRATKPKKKKKINIYNP